MKTLSTLLFWFLFSCVIGAQLPEYLPLSKVARLEALAVDARRVTISLVATNQTGGLDSTGLSESVEFTDYATLQKFLATRAMMLYKLAFWNNRLFVCKIRAIGTLGGEIFNAERVFSADRSIATTAFLLEPESFELPIRVGELRDAYVDWGFGWVPLHFEHNLLNISNGFVDKIGSKFRIKLIDRNGNEAVYTQSGQKIFDPVLELVWIPVRPIINNSTEWDEWMFRYFRFLGRGYSPEPNSFNLLVEWTLGSDLVIESSTDLRSWNLYKTIPAISGGSKMSFTVPAQDSAVFFRARSF